MEVMLAFFETPDAMAIRNDPARQGEYWGAWGAYVAAVREAGVMRGGNGLQEPKTGVSVGRSAGATQVLDGPYAETREQLGGYFIVEVADMAEAIRWAERCPALDHGGRVEARPVLPPMPG